MSDYLALVDAGVRPGLIALAAIDAEAARVRTEWLAGSATAFYRGALELAVGDLVRRLGCDGTWVWSPGNPHHAAFTTLAVARAAADGIAPVSYDLADAEHEHAAPWRWDFVRLLGSLALAKPEQKGSAFAAVVGGALDGYLHALSSNGDGRTDLSEYPPALVQLLERDAGPLAASRHLATHVTGEGDAVRLRSDGPQVRDLSARAFFLPALSSLYPEPQRLSIIDLVRIADDDPAEAGRRRWLALARERLAARSERLRLLEIRERPPSALSHLLPASPFAPVAGPAQSYSVPLGNDPLQRLIHGPLQTYVVHSRCHTRRRLDPLTLEQTDLLRLSHVWGALLGNFHLRGLRALKVDAGARALALSAEVSEARKDLARQAWEHASFMEKAHASFRRLSAQWRE